MTWAAKLMVILYYSNSNRRPLLIREFTFDFIISSTLSNWNLVIKTVENVGGSSLYLLRPPTFNPKVGGKNSQYNTCLRFHFVRYSEESIWPLNKIGAGEEVASGQVSSRVRSAVKHCEGCTSIYELSVNDEHLVYFKVRIKLYSITIT